MALRREIKVEPSRCTGCRRCELVCPLFHEGTVNPERSRVWVEERGEELLYVPHICQLCSPPPCVEACPVEALSQDAETGVIRLDEEACTQCLSCVAACPHQAIRWSEDLEKLLICDRCGGEPTCVQFCWRRALSL